MNICITFPDGKTAIFKINTKEVKSVEDIVDVIVDEMYRRQVKAGVSIKDPEKWKNAHKRWLRPRVVSALLEELGAVREFG